MKEQLAELPKARQTGYLSIAQRYTPHHSVSKQYSMTESISGRYKLHSTFILK
jgi:hypothetical protein